MKASRPVQPISGPEAFERTTLDALFSQAAVVLSIAAGMAGVPVEQSPELPLPDLAKLRHRVKLSVAEAISTVKVDTAGYLRGDVGTIPQKEIARLAHEFYEDPHAAVAAGLVEAALHSRHRLLRTAGAVAALDTTGPREDIVARLESSVGSNDPSTRDLARTALGRVRPDHPALQRLVPKQELVRRNGAGGGRAVLTHGTYGGNARWWQPGGDLYRYLGEGSTTTGSPTASFRWSGLGSDLARQVAAQQLGARLGAESLFRPDLLAHGHGGTVANLATQNGIRFNRLVLLAWPVSEDCLPDPLQAERIVDIRVNFDLVIFADRGGQRLPRDFREAANIEEHINGWFVHSAPHDPEYWRRHHLLEALV